MRVGIGQRRSLRLAVGVTLVAAISVLGSAMPVLPAQSAAAGAGAVASSGTAMISEVLAVNDSGIVDADGDRVDWIELHNPAQTSLDLAGWALTDDQTDPGKWTFPSVVLPAGGYLVVFASGKYRLDPAELHTNFKLSGDGDEVHLVRSDGSFAASLRFDAQTPDRSIGLGTNGSTVRFVYPTPGGPNAAAAAAPPAKPVFSVERGLFQHHVTLSITSPEPGAVVRYTTDGSVPTVASPVAPASLTLTESTALRARAWNAHGPSATATSTYVVVHQVIQAPYMNRSIAQGGQYGHRMVDSLTSIPSISFVEPSAIIEADYRAVSMEWLDPAGGPTFQIDAGMKLYGATSLQDPKKNLRLKFSSEFGPTKLEFPIYDGFETGASHGILPATSFDQLQLRQGAGDSQFRDPANATHLRNTYADDAMLAMGVPNPHNRFVHVYRNAKYVGVYQLRERFDADFLESYVGGSDTDYAAVNAGRSFDGPSTAWATALGNGRYSHVSQWFDVDALADYAVFNWWNATTDWYATHNWMAAGPIGWPGAADSPRWIFHNNDHDWGFGRTRNVFANNTGAVGPGNILRLLNQERHPDWIDAVSRSMTRNLAGNGPLTPSAAQARFDRRVHEVERALIADSARWQVNGWDVDGEWRNMIGWLRSTWFPQRTGVVINQLSQFRRVAEPAMHGCCQVVAGGQVQIATTDGQAADIVWTMNDTDPRSTGGGIAPGAHVVANAYSTPVTVAEPVVVTARVRRGGTWSSPQRWDLRVTGHPAPVVLNEWNAVARSELIEGSDLALGRAGGNGGDWFEVVVVEDHADLRGYQFEVTEGATPRSHLRLSSNPIWSDLRAGTIVTIAEDLPTDVSYDPARGDWHINVQATDNGSSAYLSPSNFVVSADDWQLTIRNASGGAVFGPIGEGTGGIAGITDTEVGELEGTPSATITAAAYDDSNSSTFGLPNVFGGEIQDFSALRSVVARSPDTDQSGSVDEHDVIAILRAIVGDPVFAYAAPAGNLDDDFDTDLADAQRLAQCLIDRASADCNIAR